MNENSRTTHEQLTPAEVVKLIEIGGIVCNAIGTVVEAIHGESVIYRGLSFEEAASWAKRQADTVTYWLNRDSVKDLLPEDYR